MWCVIGWFVLGLISAFVGIVLEKRFCKKRNLYYDDTDIGYCIMLGTIFGPITSIILIKDLWYYYRK